MHLRLTPIVLAAVIGFSCSKKSPDTASQRKELFQAFLTKIKPLQNGYRYQLEKQDSEGCFIPDKQSDTLFYNPPFPIVGRISNGNFHAFIHLEPGDDLFPVMRTFDNEGNQIAETVLVFGNCAGWDCDFDFCEETFTVVNQITIEDEIILITSPCDEDEKKDSELSTKNIRKRTITLSNDGELVVVDEEHESDPATYNSLDEDCDIKPEDVLLSTDHFVKYVLNDRKITLTWGNESFTRSLGHVYDCGGPPVGIPTVSWNSENYIGLNMDVVPLAGGRSFFH